MFCLQCKPSRKIRKDDRVCCQTEDTVVDPKEPAENPGEHIEDPLKLNPKMFCLRCKPTRKIRKNDRVRCQTEYATVDPDENPGEHVEDPLEPGRYHQLSNPPVYKYKVKKTGVIFISKEKDRKKAYDEFLRSKGW